MMSQLSRLALQGNMLRSIPSSLITGPTSKLLAHIHSKLAEGASLPPAPAMRQPVVEPPPARSQAPLARDAEAAAIRKRAQGSSSLW